MAEPFTPALSAASILGEGHEPPVVPEHQLLRPIGAGSSGEVWLAQNALGTYRAVKIVRQMPGQPGRTMARELEGVQKFEPVSRLHDGLIDILQVGGSAAAGYFYCVMELADDTTTGQHIVPETYVPRTLAHDLAQRRRLPLGECVRNGAAIASALGFLHRHGLLHRDIKPSNIIFVNGFPKLADIGLVAAASEARSQLGTEGFVPPEGSGTPQADIYALGKVLYQMSTGKDRNEYPALPTDLGQTPEGSGTPQADIYALGKVLYQMSTGKDRNEYPALPTDLGQTPEDFDLVRFNKIVLHACRTKPSQRFRSAEELLSALLTFQFDTGELRREESHRFYSRVVGLCGLLSGLGFLSFCIWRLIQLVEQGP